MKTSKKEFIQFLKQNNAYEQFMFNFKKQNDFFRTKKSNFVNYSPTDLWKYVDYAFNWNKTNEGWDYWAILDKKWKSLRRTIL